LISSTFVLILTVKSCNEHYCWLLRMILNFLATDHESLSYVLFVILGSNPQRKCLTKLPLIGVVRLGKVASNV
jgi:hypothetical protein